MDDTHRKLHRAVVPFAPDEPQTSVFSQPALPRQSLGLAPVRVTPPRSQPGEITALLELSAPDDEVTRMLPGRRSPLPEWRSSHEPKASLPPFDASDTTSVMPPHELPDFVPPRFEPMLSGVPDLSPGRVPLLPPPARSRPLPPLPALAPRRSFGLKLTTLTAFLGVITVFAIALHLGEALQSPTKPMGAVTVEQVPGGNIAASIPAAVAPVFATSVGAESEPAPAETPASEDAAEVISLDDLPEADEEPAKVRPTRARGSRVWAVQTKKRPRRGLRPIPDEWNDH